MVDVGAKAVTAREAIASAHIAVNATARRLVRQGAIKKGNPLERYFYDTLLHDRAALAYAIARVGPERVALGTDVPFPMRTDEPAEHVRAALALAGLPEGAFDQVTKETPMKVLGHAQTAARA